MPPGDPNNSWASASQTNLNVPRSTSVEYEKETHSTSSRRLAPPPSRLVHRGNRKPLSQQASGLSHISDSEADERSQTPSLSVEIRRGKSPLESVLDISKRALDSATLYLRQRTPELADTSAGTTNGGNGSYDYASEEREYSQSFHRTLDLEQEQQHPGKKGAHRRNRMSVDNKAYRPTASDLEESDDDALDDGKKRKKKIKKKDLRGGPLTSLPVAGYDKRRKKKKGTRNADGGEVEEDDSSESEEVRCPCFEAFRSVHIPQHSSAQCASVGRASITRTSIPPPSRNSVSRGSAPPQPRIPTDTSMDVESGVDTSGLETIPETDEAPPVDATARPPDFTSRPFSIGGFLGFAVNRTIRGFLSILAFMFRIVTVFFLILGKALGSTVDILFQKPIAFIAHINPRPFIILGKLAIIGLTIYLAWFTLYDRLVEFLPSRTAHVPYYAPDAPITNIDELAVRLQNIEAALSGLSFDHQRARAQHDLEAHAHGEVVNRVYALEARLREEARRAADAESQHRASASQGLAGLQRQMEALQTQLKSIDLAPHEAVVYAPATNDAEARERLKLLEDRLGSVESGVREAIELSKQSAKPAPSSSAMPAWWSKLTSGVATNTGLSINAGDGSDVTSLISHLVDSAVVRASTQDVISRADFALHSAGARPIPHLTSYTLEMRPTTFRGRVLGWMTGHGREVGRSPITVLHQDIHSGLCWPMSGDHGQLGVALASPAFISDVTIDHVAKEVAFDLRTAPRDMEVWGLVEGQDNLQKVMEWKTERAAQHAERQRGAEETGVPFEEDQLDDDKDAYPPTLPKGEPFIRLASFTYDIHSPSNIQSFPVRPEVRDLGVDFGVVALIVKNNWGKKDYTCLYRFRVHGERLGGMPQPFAPEDPDS